MIQLPFGDNLFAAKATPSSNTNADKTLFLAPPAPKAPPLVNPMQKKRITHVMINDSGRGEATKKRKTTVSDSPCAAFLIMGDLAKDNFEDEDVVSWSKSSEARFCFKLAFGETFFMAWI